MEETPVATEEEVLTNPEVEEQQPVDEPTEETPEEPVEEPETPSPEPEEAPEPSRREQLRIGQLLTKYGTPKPQAPQARQDALDYATALDADPETIKALQADRENYANSRATDYQRQLETNMFHTRLEIDAPKVETKHPQLDKSSPQFEPAVADALNTHYLHLVGYDPQTNTVQNPNLRYADFVDAQFELAGRLASRQAAETTKNIAKQVATTGIRPNGSSAKGLNLNKAPEAMTDEELDAVINLSRDSQGRFTKSH